MPSPKLILEAEQAVTKAARAARAIGADEQTQDGLRLAEQMLAEIRHFAYGVNEGHSNISLDGSTRLLSMILGFEVRVTGVAAGFNDLDSYKRQPR